MAKVAVFAGTTNGVYVFESDGKRRKWTRRGPYLKGSSVNHFAWDARTKTVYAATLDEGIFASRTRGRTWTALNRGLSIRKVWTVAVNPQNSDELWAGTHFSYLFRSADRGRSWSVVPGYLEAPGKEARYGDWAFGTTGNCLHTVLLDPKEPKRIYAVSTAGSGGTGALRSDDGGSTWQKIKQGTDESCPVDGHKPDHLNEVHTCVHRVAYVSTDPSILYQQNHCGVYRSADYGTTWTDISDGLAARHGFPIAVHPKETGTAFVVPAYQGRSNGGCEKHNSCIRGQLAVYRTRTGGRRWERLTTGLPDDVHCVVLRHGMDVDALDPVGVYIGTSSGDVYGGREGGDAWHAVGSKLPRIQGIVAMTWA